MMLAEIIWNSQSIMFVMIFSIPIIAVLAAFWHGVETHKSDNELKRAMIERGMSPDNIQLVLDMTPNKKSKSSGINVTQHIGS